MAEGKKEKQETKEKQEKKESKLRGSVPQESEKRLKLFMFGPAGIGKTMAALQFPKAYIIDTERGCDHYGDTIKKNGSVLFQSNDAEEIRHELETLLTEDHEYRTLIIDPMTKVYEAIQDLWTSRFEREAEAKMKNAEMQDFGLRYWGKVKSEYKSLQRLLLKLDMNVIITAHQKDVYGNNSQKIGVSFDSMKGDDYFFDYVFRLEKRGQERTAVKVKERADLGKSKFPDEFIFSYDNFQKFYGGKVMERKATTIALATVDQVNRLDELIKTIRLPDDTVDKWLNKADVDTFSEMMQDQVQKCIEFCEKKLSAARGAK